MIHQILKGEIHPNMNTTDKLLVRSSASMLAYSHSSQIRVNISHMKYYSHQHKMSGFGVCLSESPLL